MMGANGTGAHHETMLAPAHSTSEINLQMHLPYSRSHVTELLRPLTGVHLGGENVAL